MDGFITFPHFQNFQLCLFIHPTILLSCLSKKKKPILLSSYVLRPSVKLVPLTTIFLKALYSQLLIIFMSMLLQVLYQLHKDISFTFFELFWFPEPFLEVNIVHIQFSN